MAETNVDAYATKADLAQFETKLVERMGQLEVRMTKWIAGMLLGHLAAAVGLTVTLIQVIK